MMLDRDQMPKLFEGTDALANLTGRLDAAIDHGCPLSLEEIRERLVAARETIFNAIHGVK